MSSAAVNERPVLTWYEEAALQIEVCWSLIRWRSQNSPDLEFVGDNANAVVDSILDQLLLDVVWHPCVNAALKRERHSDGVWNRRKSAPTQFAEVLYHKLEPLWKPRDSQVFGVAVAKVLADDSFFDFVPKPAPPRFIHNRATAARRFIGDDDQCANWWSWLRVLNYASAQNIRVRLRQTARHSRWNPFAGARREGESPGDLRFVDWIALHVLPPDIRRGWPPWLALPVIDLADCTRVDSLSQCFRHPESDLVFPSRRRADSSAAGGLVLADTDQTGDNVRPDRVEPADRLIRSQLQFYAWLLQLFTSSPRVPERLSLTPFVKELVTSLLPAGWSLEIENFPVLTASEDPSSADVPAVPSLWHRERGIPPGPVRPAIVFHYGDTMAEGVKAWSPGIERVPPQSPSAILARDLRRLNAMQRELLDDGYGYDPWLDQLANEVAAAWETTQHVVEVDQGKPARGVRALDEPRKLAELWFRLQALPNHSRLHGARNAFWMRLQEQGIEIVCEPQHSPEIDQEREGGPDDVDVFAAVPTVPGRVLSWQKIVIRMNGQEKRLLLCPLPVEMASESNVRGVNELLQCSWPLLDLIRHHLPISHRVASELRFWDLALAILDRPSEAKSTVEDVRIRAFLQSAFQEWACYANQASSHTTSAALVDAWGAFLRLLCQRLPEHVSKLPIPIDAQSGDPDLPVLNSRADIVVRWRQNREAVASQVHGRLLGAEFSANSLLPALPQSAMVSPSLKTSVTLALGKQFTSLAPWLELEVAPFAREFPAVHRFIDRISRIPLAAAPEVAEQPEHLNSLVDKELERLTWDLGRDPEAFHRFVFTAIDGRTPNHPLRYVLSALLPLKTWTCWPKVVPLNPGEYEVRCLGAAADPKVMNAVEWKPNSLPFGTAIPAECRFAITPEASRIVLSEGPPFESDAISALRRLSSLGLASLSEFTTAASRLRIETLRHQRDGLAIDVAEISRLLRRGLAQAVCDGTDIPETVWRDAETWLGGLGCRLVPQPPVSVSSIQAAMPNLPVRFDASKRDTCVIEELGLASNQATKVQTYVPCSAFRSAGKIPEGYEALLATARQIDETWVNKIEELPQKLIDRQGETFAARLFSEIHQANKSDPRFQTMETRLLELLSLNWKIAPFSPSSESEWPANYIQNVATNLNRRGHVRRVVCPGLRDEKRLWLKAIVELE